MGDTDKIKEVMINLLANAFNFSPPEGAVEIKVAEDGDSIRTEVIDNGEGIEKDRLAKVFDKFMTPSDVLPGKGGGVGLGLYIAKGIVEAHKGNIWAESEGKNKGSRFVFTLPKTKVGEEQAMAAEGG